jgi:hypothetical protein
VRGDFGTVLALLQADKAAVRQARGGGRDQGEEDETTAQAKLRKTVLSLLKRGQISRAVRRICSHGIANMQDPQVQAALQAKYTVRGRELPPSVTKGQCVDNLDLRDSLLLLDPGVSPGFGGMRNEHLRCLAEQWEDRDLGLLESFSLRYLNGDLPPFFYKVWGSVSTTPLFKSREKDALRPLGVKFSLIRDLHKHVVAKNRGAFNEVLQPQQLALSKAGGAKLVHQVRMMFEDRRDFIVVKVDMRNAHNEVSRAAVLEALEREPTLRHISLHAATCLASHTGLESGGELWGEAG